VVIGYVGRLVPIKDVDNLLRAVALVQVQIPNLRLVVAGDGELRSPLETLAADLGLAERVTFLGWQQDLATVYGAMDLFVLTSLNEGTPVSLIEAMAAGVPVVATAVGGVPDVVEHAVTGMLVPPQQPDVLAAAIVAALTDAERTARMAARARTSVRDRFDSARLVQDTDMLYRRTLMQARRTPPPTPLGADGSQGTVR
jgi:glycosyltransferase involved in cell wall biosynthesis